MAAAAAARVTLIVEAVKSVFEIGSTNLPSCIITEKKNICILYRPMLSFVCTRYSTFTIYSSQIQLYIHYTYIATLFHTAMLSLGERVKIHYPFGLSYKGAATLTHHFDLRSTRAARRQNEK